MATSFNNWLVESLRQGSSQAVDTLMAMGQGPSVMLDWVEPAHQDVASGTPQLPTVASQSIWFWVHQAPTAAAAVRCWEGWILRELAQLPTSKIDLRLKSLFGEAVLASLSSGQFIPLLETWVRTLEFSEAVEGRWSNEHALGVLGAQVCAYPQTSPGLLGLLELEGLLDRAGALGWAQNGSGVWTAAAKMALPGVFDALLDVSSPVPRSVLVRMEAQLFQTMGSLLQAGPGAGQHENMLERTLDCLELVQKSGLTPSPSRISPQLQSLIDSASSASGWTSTEISRLDAWRLTASLSPGSTPPADKSPRPRF